MKLLRITFLTCLTVGFSSCLSPDIKESDDDIVSQELYEDYLRSALYGTVNEVHEDPIVNRERQLEYYTIVAGDEDIARIIYDEASLYNIPPELVFALVFSESNFDPLAINENKNSIDRGLFQLNSKSFPDLSEEDFFKPEINVPLGIAYLRYCLDIGGNEVAALAMYNAGPNRVKDSRTPRMTLDYIAKVQEYRTDLEQGIIPEEFKPVQLSIPDMKSVKNMTLLMEQSGKIN